MKILIICEFFKPSNSTASFRAMAWQKYLPEANIFPIFLTTTQTTKLSPDVSDEKETSVVRVSCKLPIIRTLRYRFSGSILGRVFGLIDEALDNYSFYTPFKRLESAAREITAETKFDLILVTVPSFALIDVARKIANERQINWIVDFRDDWVTNEEVTGFTRFKYRFEHHLFKSYLRGAKYLIAVSEHQRQKIESASNIPAVVFENGFDFYDDANSNKDTAPDGISFRSDYLNIIYAGTLYKSQKLSHLQAILDGCKASVRDKISITFIGAETPELMAFSRCNRNVQVVKGRLSKSVVDNLVCNADIALLIGYQKGDGTMIKGVPSSKLYEYIKLEKPVFLAQSDHDIIQTTLDKIGLLISGDNLHENIEILEKLSVEKIKKQVIRRTVNQIEYQKLFRKRQTAEFASWLLENF